MTEKSGGQVLCGLAIMLIITAATACGEESNPGAGYRQIDRYVLPDYSAVPRRLVEAPRLFSANARYALMVLGRGLKNTVILIWDESEGTGKGFDTMYVDVDLDGDLTEPGEKFLCANGDSKKFPQEKYGVPPIVLPGGDRFGLGLETHGDPDTISYPTGYGWTDAQGRHVLGLAHLPGNTRLQWGTSIQDAPVHVIGGEYVAVPSIHEGVEPPVDQSLILPGQSVGRTRVGNTITLHWRMASPGSRPPATELRSSAGGGQVYLRVLASGKTIRELPFNCGCSCAESFLTSLTVPADIPPGRHAVVFRTSRSPEQGGPADFLFPIEITNETYGQPLPDTIGDELAGKLEAQTRLVSFRRAGEPEQLVARSSREQPLAATVSDTWFDCFHREGFIYNLDQCRGGEPLLVLGLRAWAADSNRGLVRFDIDGLPADAQVKAAWLQLCVQDHAGCGADSRLAASMLRRAWDEVPCTNGTYACQIGPRYKRDGGEKWGKPGAQDAATDRQPEPVSAAALATLATQAGTPASAATAAACAEGFCKLPAGTGRQAQPVVGLDVTAAVRQWLARPAENHGLLLALEGAGTLTLYASESDNAALRPTLFVAYEGGEAKSVLTVPAGEDLVAARKAATEAGKPLLLVFGSPSCRYCEDLKKRILPHKDVAGVLQEKVVCQTLDVAHWPGLAEKLGISSLPMAVILNPADLKVVGRMSGRELLMPAPFAAFVRDEAL